VPRPYLKLDLSRLSALVGITDWWCASSASEGVRDPLVQQEINRLEDAIDELQDKIESIQSDKFGYGPHDVSGSMQQLKELLKHLADYIAKNPPK
jgi:hypothetical protein